MTSPMLQTGGYLQQICGKCGEWRTMYQVGELYCYICDEWTHNSATFVSRPDSHLNRLFNKQDHEMKQTCLLGMMAVTHDKERKSKCVQLHCRTKALPGFETCSKHQTGIFLISNGSRWLQGFGSGLRIADNENNAHLFRMSKADAKLIGNFVFGHCVLKRLPSENLSSHPESNISSPQDLQHRLFE